MYLFGRRIIYLLKIRFSTRPFGIEQLNKKEMV